MSMTTKGVWHLIGIGLLWALALSGCETPHVPPPAPSPSVVTPTAAGQSELVQSLQRQVRERDRRIAELTSQLNTLKLIDQDIDATRQSNRLPITLTYPGAGGGR